MLITVLILAAVMLSVAIVGSIAFVREIQGMSAAQNKKAAAASAAACMEHALNELGRNAGYTGNETLTIGSATCTIPVVISGGGTWTLQSRSQAVDQFARLQVVLSSRTPIVITSWDEGAVFAP